MQFKKIDNKQSSWLYSNGRRIGAKILLTSLNAVKKMRPTAFADDIALVASGNRENECFVINSSQCFFPVSENVNGESRSLNDV